jgi:hypothetical protein
MLNRCFFAVTLKHRTNYGADRLGGAGAKSEQTNEPACVATRKQQTGTQLPSISGVVVDRSAGDGEMEVRASVAATAAAKRQKRRQAAQQRAAAAVAAYSSHAESDGLRHGSARPLCAGLQPAVSSSRVSVEVRLLKGLAGTPEPAMMTHGHFLVD